MVTDPADGREIATHFLDCIRSGQPPLVGFDMGLRLPGFKDALARSVQEGVPVPVGAV